VTRSSVRSALRATAETLTTIDIAVYQRWEKDPLEPIIGGGDPNARICFFGRDPGKDEVRWGMPFIGAGGQKVRKGLYKVLYNEEMPDFQASMDVGTFAFWANTVPFKPVGNKAWSMAVQKQCHPQISDVLVHDWFGRDILTLGRNAFFWFGIHQSKQVRTKLKEFWSNELRFEQFIEISIQAQDGTTKTVRIHPLPHPSPLNATWYSRFPSLLEGRLRTLALTRKEWTVHNGND